MQLSYPNQTHPVRQYSCPRFAYVLQSRFIFTQWTRARLFHAPAKRNVCWPTRITLSYTTLRSLTYNHLDSVHLLYPRRKRPSITLSLFIMSNKMASGRMPRFFSYLIFFSTVCCGNICPVGLNSQQGYEGEQHAGREIKFWTDGPEVQLVKSLLHCYRGILSVCIFFSLGLRVTYWKSLNKAFPRTQVFQTWKFPKY